MRFEKIVEGTKSLIRLNLGDLKLHDFNYDPKFLDFKIETYVVLHANKPQYQWDWVFGKVHEFLDSLPIKEQEAFAKMIIYMHCCVVDKLNMDAELVPAKVVELETELNKVLESFDKEFDLMPQLLKFTQENIKISVFPNAGERPQDRVEMTFYPDEVIALTSVALLCKMMTPIIGTFIESCKKRLDNIFREIHCVAIFKDILTNRYPALIDKLQHYLEQINKKQLSKINITHVFYGCTPNTIPQYIYAVLLTRKFITVDLMKPDGNLMTYVISCAREATQTQYNSSSFPSMIKDIILPNSNRKESDDDGNSSILEAESKSSIKTADFPLIMEAGVKQLCERFIDENELDAEMIEAADAYYNTNHVSLDVNNTYIFGIVYSSALGGAKSIEYLNGLSVNKLTAMLQAYFIKQGYFNLVNLISAVNTGRIKTLQTGPDNQLKAIWSNSEEYKTCQTKWPLTVGNLGWSTGLQQLVDTITTRMFVYNTAPSIWEALNHEILNGQPYQVSEEISKDICSLILQFYP